MPTFRSSYLMENLADTYVCLTFLSDVSWDKLNYVKYMIVFYSIDIEYLRA